jgi:aminoglycoside 3-N-acetyltransferase
LVIVLTYSEIKAGLESLNLKRHQVIAHASVRAFGRMDGGAETLLQALIDSTRGVVMPTFTYKTMLNPDVGPANNGMAYGTQGDLNKMAEPFHPDMPVDPMMGILPEVLRVHPQAKRSSHPIQSFAAINADAVIHSQNIFNPLAPIGMLAESNGWVLLLGVDHMVNTSIHFAEKLAGRVQFIRWAMTRERVIECPGFPGDSEGFNAIAPDVEKYTRRTMIGGAWVQAVHLQSLVNVVVQKIRQDPFALLCNRPDCERCNAVRWA